MIPRVKAGGQFLELYDAQSRDAVLVKVDDVSSVAESPRQTTLHLGPYGRVLWVRHPYADVVAGLEEAVAAWDQPGVTADAAPGTLVPVDIQALPGRRSIPIPAVVATWLLSVIATAVLAFGQGYLHARRGPSAQPSAATEEPKVDEDPQWCSCAGEVVGPATACEGQSSGLCHVSPARSWLAATCGLAGGRYETARRLRSVRCRFTFGAMLGFCPYSGDPQAWRACLSLMASPGPSEPEQPGPRLPQSNRVF